MKRAGWLFAFAFALCTLGCGNSTDARNSTTSAPSASAAKAEPAPRATIGDPFEILSVLSVEHEVDVLAQRDGAVMETLKDDGQRVQAGEILAQLDDRTIRAQLDKAKADVDEAQNNVKYNEAELNAKQANYRRYQQLRELGLGSQADLDNAEFLAKGAEYDLKALHAVVDHHQAAIRELQVELDRTRIRAPFSGVVARRYIRQGQGVLKDEKCFRVSQLNPLQVQFQVPENSGRKPRLGDPVQLSLAEDAGRVFTAKVVKLSPMVDPASDSYDVTARLTSADLSELKPGMAVRVSWSGTATPKP
ncbi:MAG: efflux RND transporter periplasmic adaptor subunit [Candidatus Acidiferrales bacterium]